MEKRKTNVKAVLESLLERAGEVELTAASLVSAVQAYSKIDNAGRWVERTESLDISQAFERMSSDELLAYAERGELPKWLKPEVATPQDGSEQAAEDDLNV